MVLVGAEQAQAFEVPKALRQLADAVAKDVERLEVGERGDVLRERRQAVLRETEPLKTRQVPHFARHLGQRVAVKIQHHLYKEKKRGVDSENKT